MRRAILLSLLFLLPLPACMEEGGDVCDDASCDSGEAAVDDSAAVLDRAPQGILVGDTHPDAFLEVRDPITANVDTNGECQQMGLIPGAYGGTPHHDHYQTAWGCGAKVSGVEHTTCNSAICAGPPTQAGHVPTTFPGSVCYCLTPSGGCGTFSQCWDVSDPCAVFRKIPIPTAATCPAGRPFCDDCFVSVGGPSGTLTKSWGHDPGPDKICKTADDIYKPYWHPNVPAGFPQGGCLQSDAEAE